MLNCILFLYTKQDNVMLNLLCVFIVLCLFTLPARHNGMETLCHRVQLWFFFCDKSNCCCGTSQFILCDVPPHSDFVIWTTLSRVKPENLHHVEFQIQFRNLDPDFFLHIKKLVSMLFWALFYFILDICLFVFLGDTEKLHIRSNFRDYCYNIKEKCFKCNNKLFTIK